jgi:serine/threonine protein phosphatase PrpC
VLKVTDHAQKTDTGRQRNANEDSFFSKPPLFAVADGMGGAQAGEVASKIAADAFDELDVTDGSPEGILEGVAQDANRAIHELAQKDSSRAGMGTTLTAALVHGDEVSLAHVGDSRAYVLRDGELKRLTKDHSLVEELRRQGRLTDEQAEEHPQRSIITRALGPEPDVRVDRMTVTARPGDVFILCSDGLTTMVGEDEIKAILGEARNLRSAVSKLVDAANKAGGRDNITAVAFRLEDAGVAAERDESPTLIDRTAQTAERVRAVAAERVRPGAPAERTAAAPPEPGRPGWVRAAIAAAIALAILAVLVFGARQIYFLGTDEGGRVALFRGLPYELPLGIDLYSEQRSIGVTADSLSEERQKVVTEHKLRGHNDANDIIDDIEQREGSVAPIPPPTPPAKQGDKGGAKKAGRKRGDNR